MDSATLTALATGLLVIVGLAQVGVLIAQRRQSRLDLVESYWRRWKSSSADWAAVVFVGRRSGEYYQVAEPELLWEFGEMVQQHSFYAPSTWALDSVRSVCGTMSDVCIRVLQGQLTVSDAYPIFGTELLRQSRPLRVLLDSSYRNRWESEGEAEEHAHIRKELQTWLVYHDGIRRRCLILLDLLWAEAARLEDLPPSELLSAADAKQRTGKQNRDRVFQECLRLRGVSGVFRALFLADYLRHAEYKLGKVRRRGLVRERLQHLNHQWTDRLLYGLRA